MMGFILRETWFFTTFNNIIMSNLHELSRLINALGLPSTGVLTEIRRAMAI